MKKNRAIKVISYSISIILILGVIGGAYYLTNGFKKEITTFDVLYNGQSVVTSSDINLPYAEEITFNVKCLLQLLDKTEEKKDYTIRVVPNITESTNFDFNVDGKIYSFAGESDLTSAFDIKKNVDSFSLFLPKTLTMENILKTNYPNSTITIPTALTELNYFKIVVSSFDLKNEVSFNFFLKVYVQGIYLDKGAIIIR